MVIRCANCGELFEKICSRRGCSTTYTCPFCGYSGNV